MKGSIPTLAVLGISLLLSACGSMNRADSQRMLDMRAAYGLGQMPPDGSLKEAGVEGFQNAPVPVRTRPKVAAIWIHPHETANHEYFWGGWISVVVEKDQWVLNQAGRLPKAKAIGDVTNLLRHKKKSKSKHHDGTDKKTGE